MAAPTPSWPPPSSTSATTASPRPSATWPSAACRCGHEPGRHPLRRAWPGAGGGAGGHDRRGAAAGLHERRSAGGHAAHGPRPLLEPLAGPAVAQGRALGPRADRGGALRQLRAEQPPAARAPAGRRRVSHRPPHLLPPQAGPRWLLAGRGGMGLRPRRGIRAYAIQGLTLPRLNPVEFLVHGGLPPSAVLRPLRRRLGYTR